MPFLNMFEMRSPDLGRLREREDVVGLIPLAAVEQHGPHLPIGTDAIIATHVAQKTAERLSVPALVVPTLPAGLSRHHLGFPGTVTISAALLGEFVRSYISAMIDLGVRRFALFSSHGGNFAFLTDVVRDLAAENAGVRFIAYDDLDRYVSVMARAARGCGITVPASDIHAGGLESSQMLHLWGSDRITIPDGLVGYTAAEPGWQEKMFNEGVRGLSEIGVLGDPSASSAAAGEAICEALADALASWIEEELELGVVSSVSAPSARA